MAERGDTAIRAIELDFNGTLAHDDHLVAPLCVDAFASVGVALTVEEYHRELAALPDREVFELAIRSGGMPFDAARRDALIQARVDGYMAAVDVDNGKPDPEGFRHALAELNTLTAADPPIEPHRIVAVEDATRRGAGRVGGGHAGRGIRGLGYDPASGYADVVVDRLDRTALELMLGIEGA